MKKPEKKIKVAIIAPPFTNIPPKGQGGTERIIWALNEGLVKRGFKVTLFGAGQAKTKAKFIPLLKKPISQLKFNPAFIESSRPLRLESAYLLKVINELIKRKEEFDIVLNHARGGYLLLPLQEKLKIPIVNVLHLPIFPELAEAIKFYKDHYLISISKNQQKKAPYLKYIATVYNGVNLAEFKFNLKPKNYFLFMGALGEHKNPKEAILAAKKAKVKLILAGGKKREPYFSKEIKPLIDGSQIKYIGEVSGKQRLKLFREAKALLFPIKWEEPFGLVMIEAMACGTPVIAYKKGAVSEIIKNKKTGFIVRNLKEMIKAIKEIDKIDRRECRIHVEKNFSLEKMINGYEEVIKKLSKRK